MGCGISKFSLDEDVGGGGGGGRGGFHPIRQRIEGIRRNRRSVSDGNPSTKLLLKDGGEEDVVDSNDGRKSVSSHVVMIAKVVQEDSMMMKAVDSDVATNKLGGEEDKYEEGEGEEYEGRISDFSDSLFMGSPSFREYCKSEDSGNSVEEKREKERQMKEGIASLNPDEVPKAQSMKKGRRGRRFRKVFPMSRPAAVRNLLNVTTCYNSNVSSAHVRHGKPAENAV